MLTSIRRKEKTLQDNFSVLIVDLQDLFVLVETKCVLAEMCLGYTMSALSRGTNYEANQQMLIKIIIIVD